MTTHERQAADETDDKIEEAAVFLRRFIKASRFGLGHWHVDEIAREAEAWLDSQGLGFDKETLT